MTPGHGCILVVCGLPGSGKSTLVRWLETGLTAEFRIIVVEYDLLMPSDVEKKLIEQTAAEASSQWKSYREEIVTCVDSLLEQLCGLSSDTDCLCQEMSQPASVGDELWTRFFHGCTPQKVFSQTDRPFVIVIDDNMYYRSMRYQYYQLARKHTVGFSELYLDCSVETAVSQNANRVSGRVDQDVIQLMVSRFEAPNRTVCQWEKHSLKMSSHSPSMSDIRMLLMSAIDDPVTPDPVEDVTGREESRQICSRSVIHQADQILRRIVAHNMSALKSSGASRDELKHKAEQLADKRLRLLQDMKSGLVAVTLTEDAEDASKHSNSELYQFIQSVFCSDCN